MKVSGEWAPNAVPAAKRSLAGQRVGAATVGAEEAHSELLELRSPNLDIAKPKVSLSARCIGPRDVDHANTTLQ